MSYLVLIGIGGALGAMSRYAVEQTAMTHLGSSHIGTFATNISGSFVLGILIGIISSHVGLPPEVRVFFAVGFLGSYTTFSTLTLAIVQSLEKGDIPVALFNLIASVSIGLTAAAVGMVLGRTI